MYKQYQYKGFQIMVAEEGAWIRKLGRRVPQQKFDNEEAAIAHIDYLH